jgi:anti-sigma factor RsiW
MTSLLHQLDNESALVMFLAGELPPEDHAVVERRLAADPEFRAQLDELRSSYRTVEDAIAASDAVERVALPPATASRRVGQAVRSWHARRLAQPRERELGGRLRIPGWVYAAASVAAAGIVALGVWGLRSDTSMVKLPPLTAPSQQAPEVAVNIPAPAVIPDEPELPSIHDASETKVLADAEDELYAMSHRSPGDVPSILLMSDTDEQ